MDETLVLLGFHEALLLILRQHLQQGPLFEQRGAWCVAAMKPAPCVLSRQSTAGARGRVHSREAGAHVEARGAVFGTKPSMGVSIRAAIVPSLLLLHHPDGAARHAHHAAAGPHLSLAGFLSLVGSNADPNPTTLSRLNQSCPGNMRLLKGQPAAWTEKLQGLQRRFIVVICT